MQTYSYTTTTSITVTVYNNHKATHFFSRHGTSVHTTEVDRLYIHISVPEAKPIATFKSGKHADQTLQTHIPIRPTILNENQRTK